jgi:hypothetical protein
MTTRTVARHRRPDEASGPEGNEHLTAMTGVVLLIGFAVEGFTILQLHRLLWLHFALGFALCVPVAVKLCSVLYRFGRYYTRSQPYVRKGPPAPLLRVLGPLVVLTSLAVLGTGVILGISGPGQEGNWLFLHKASFILWFGVMFVHVVAYAPKLPRLLAFRWQGKPGPAAAPHAGVRYLTLAVALAGAILVGAITMHLSGQWTGGG